MKKTLTMILTLALVICMMPTSAFAAATGNVLINGVNYTVTFNQNVFNYNAAPQAPVPTFTATEGTTIPTFKYTYQKSGESSTANVAPTEAGTYEMFAAAESGQAKKIGDFTINPIFITQTEIVNIKKLDETIKSNSDDKTLKTYFKLTLGGRMLSLRIILCLPL